METAGLANYNNFAALGDLKLQAKQSPDAAIKEVAKQFESIFVNMMMKSMRDALPQDGMFNTDQMKTYQGMFDQQLSLDMSNRGGIGLAEVIERQLSKTAGLNQYEDQSKLNTSLHKNNTQIEIEIK